MRVHMISRWKAPGNPAGAKQSLKHRHLTAWAAGRYGPRRQRRRTGPGIGEVRAGLARARPGLSPSCDVAAPGPLEREGGGGVVHWRGGVPRPPGPP